MKRRLLSCGGIILVLVAVSLLGERVEVFPKGKTWFSGYYDRIIGLSLIVQGAAVALGAALCVGRAIIPLKSAPGRSGTTVSGRESVTIGGGPVLPICAIPFLYISLVGLTVVVRGAAKERERIERGSGQSRDDRVDYYRRQELMGRTFGVFSLVVAGMLLGTPLFLKRHVWQLGWRINGAGVGIAIGGLLLFGMALLVWIASGTILHGREDFYCPVGVLGVLAGTFVTVFGGIKAVAGDRLSD